MDNTPDKIKDILIAERLAIELYDYRSVAYRGKVYSISYSVNCGGYYATFMCYRSIAGSYKAPMLLGGSL